MKHTVVLVLGCIMTCVISVLLGCNNRRDSVKEMLMKIQARPVNLCLNKMQCRIRNRDTVVVDSVKPDLRFVVYVDSTECTPCELDKMYMWNDLISKARQYKGKLKYIFVIAPKSKESLVDIYLSIEYSGLRSHVYIDTAYVFRDSNKEFPMDSKFHNFLLDKHDSVLFVGNPLKSKTLENVYNRTVKSVINN